jgi:hypothetical protein
MKPHFLFNPRKEMSKKEENPDGPGNPAKQQEQHDSASELPPISHKLRAEEK